ncbi:MAG: hypothetical protein QM704_16795 [Anaeromyxobacteraceae bacterium]
MTTSDADGYGARPMPARPLGLLVLAALAATACTPVERPPGPLDRFTFPTGLALANDRLLVVSSNYDLTYEDDKGGSVLAVDPSASERQDGTVGGPPRVTSAVRIPSFGGEVRVAGASACGLARDEALVPNRLTGELLRLGFGADGALSCGADCHIPLAGTGEGDPYSVEVVCRPGKPFAYVGWLRSRKGTQCPNGISSTTCAVLSEVPLDGSDAPATGNVLLNAGGVRRVRYEPQTGLLFFATTGSDLGWLDLSGGCSVASSDHPCPTQSIDLSTSVRGLQLRSVGFSSPGLPLRVFVTGKLYDPSLLAAGVEFDVGGVLLVLGFEPSAFGGYNVTVQRTIPIGTDAAEVAVIPRAGQRDLVVVSATADGELWFWDDELGTISGVVARTALGTSEVGAQPYGLAFVDRKAGALPVRLYVGSFGDGVVSVVDLNPLAPDPLAQTPGVVIRGRIGE